MCVISRIGEELIRKKKNRIKGYNFMCTEKIKDRVSKQRNESPYINEKQRYKIELPDADDTLKSMCVKKTVDLYGNPIPFPILDRLTAELDAIRINGYAGHYLIASELVKYSLEKGYPVSNRGMLPSSLVTFLSGISEVNPLPAHYRCPDCHHFEPVENRNCGLDLPDKICPVCGSVMMGGGVGIHSEINMGLSLEREPDIFLNFAPGIYREILEYIKARFSDDRVIRAGIKVEESDGSIRKSVHPGGIYIVPGDTDLSDVTQLRENEPADEFTSNDGLLVTEEDYHTVDDKLKRYNILMQPELDLLHDLESETGVRREDIRFNDESVPEAFFDTDGYFMKRFGVLFRQAIGKIRSRSFSGLARVVGILQGAGTWTGNGEELIKEGIALEDLISCRDDVMEFLMSKGFSKKDSYTAMQQVRGGKGLPQELIGKMKAAGIPAWYIESCSRIQYAYPRAQIIEYTIIIWRQAYYRMHFPKIYKRTCCLEGNRIREHCGY